MSDVEQFIRECKAMFNASYMRILKSDLPDSKKAYFIERLFRNKELIETQLGREIEMEGLEK